MVRTPAKVPASLWGSDTSVHLGCAASEPLGAVGLLSAVSCGMAHGEWDPGLTAQALVWHILLLHLIWGGEGGHPWHLLSLRCSPERKVQLGWALQRIYTLRDSPGGLCLPHSTVTCCTRCAHSAAHEDGLGIIWQLTGLTMSARQKRHQHNIHTGSLEITSVPSNGHMDCLGALKPNTQECGHIAFCLRLLWRSCSNTYHNYLLRALIGTLDKYPNCNTLCS